MLCAFARWAPRCGRGPWATSLGSCGRGSGGRPWPGAAVCADRAVVLTASAVSPQVLQGAQLIAVASSDPAAAGVDGSPLQGSDIQVQYVQLAPVTEHAAAAQVGAPAGSPRLSADRSRGSCRRERSSGLLLPLSREDGDGSLKGTCCAWRPWFLGMPDDAELRSPVLTRVPVGSQFCHIPCRVFSVNSEAGIELCLGAAEREGPLT